MTIAPAPDDMPERPKGPQKPKSPRTFEEVLRELRPDLQKLPAEKIPTEPPDPMVLESVEEFVQANGMTVPDSCPSTIALAGEFLDRSSLREGRVGFHNNVRVLSFLYRFSDKLLRAVVIYPRDGVDARFLGMAICWGLVANVPESIAQSRILETKEFFSINAFDPAKILDVPALDGSRPITAKPSPGNGRRSSVPLSPAPPISNANAPDWRALASSSVMTFTLNSAKPSLSTTGRKSGRLPPWARSVWFPWPSSSSGFSEFRMWDLFAAT